MYDISVVVPVYNASGFIGTFIDQLCVALKKIPLRSEIILVDDSSEDDTVQVAINNLKLSKVPSSLYVLKNNWGQYHTTVMGLAMAKGSTLITIDCDMAPSPLVIGDIWEHSIPGPMSIVYTEFGRKRTFFRTIGTVVFNSLIKMKTGKPLGSRQGSSFRFLDRKLFEQIVKSIQEPTTLDILLMRNAANISFIPLEEAVISNLSRHSMVKLFRYFFTLLVTFMSTSKKNDLFTDPCSQIKQDIHFNR